MSYDEIEIEDMSWSDKLQAYTYPCPCGDLFQITLVGSAAPLLLRAAEKAALNSLCLPMQEELKSGEDIARCPSCSLYITVVYDPVSLSGTALLCAQGGAA